MDSVITAAAPAPLTLTYLNGPDVAALALTDGEILEAVEAGLAAQGRGETVIEPRMHLVPGRGVDGHFNVLRGFVAPLALAGVKVVGDFVDNYRHGLPSEMGLLNLFDPATGQPVAVIDAAGLTDMRTGAVTAHRRAPPCAQVQRACSGTSARAARRTGTCACSTACSISTRFACIRAGPKAAMRSPRKLSRDLGKPVVATDDWESCVRGADIVVEASRLSTARRRCCAPDWIKPRRVRRALRHDERRRALAHRHHGQARRRRLGPVQGGPFGSLRAHVNAGKLSERTLHAELGEIVAGRKPGRERDDETILLWHRGLSLSDIALGAAMLERRSGMGIGQTVALSHECRREALRGQRADVLGQRAVAAAWRTLLDWVDRARRRRCRGHRLSAAAPLPALWARDDLGCVFMCGYPFATAQPPPRLLAAPVPSPAAYRDAARLLDRHRRSRRQRHSRRCADILGRRFAFTTPDSQSGYQAPRALFARCEGP